METFKILHIEDDIDCNFLLTESLRRTKNLRVEWAANRDASKKFMTETTYDLIVCDGCIPGWDDHFRDVLCWSKNTPVCVYSARNNTDFEPFALDSGLQVDPRDVFTIFSKSSEGTHNLVRYIKTRALKREGSHDHTAKRIS